MVSLSALVFVGWVFCSLVTVAYSRSWENVMSGQYLVESIFRYLGDTKEWKWGRSQKEHQESAHETLGPHQEAESPALPKMGPPWRPHTRESLLFLPTNLMSLFHVSLYFTASLVHLQKTRWFHELPKFVWPLILDYSIPEEVEKSDIILLSGTLLHNN